MVEYMKIIQQIYHISRIKNSKCMIISIDTENTFDKIYQSEKDHLQKLHS